MMIIKNPTRRCLCVKGQPHLALFSTQDIEEGTEVCYHYGYGDFPWRIKVRDIVHVFVDQLPWNDLILIDEFIWEFDLC